MVLVWIWEGEWWDGLGLCGSMFFQGTVDVLCSGRCHCSVPKKKGNPGAGRDDAHQCEPLDREAPALPTPMRPSFSRGHILDDREQSGEENQGSVACCSQLSCRGRGVLCLCSGAAVND